MTGITITGVKIVGMCSKCRKKYPDTEIMKDKYGRVYKDKELACVGCAFTVKQTSQKKTNTQSK